MSQKLTWRIDRLRALRERQGWSQRELGRRSGILETLVAKYERNLNEPGASELRQIAQALGVSADYLLGTTDDPQGHVGDGTLDTDEQAMIDTYRREGWPGVASLSVDKWRQQT